MSFEESTKKHWEYVKEAIRDGRPWGGWINLKIEDYLVIIGYHYKTAMLHGYKHGVQSLSEKASEQE